MPSIAESTWWSFPTPLCPQSRTPQEACVCHAEPILAPPHPHTPHPPSQPAESLPRSDQHPAYPAAHRAAMHPQTQLCACVRAPATAPRQRRVSSRRGGGGVLCCAVLSWGADQRCHASAVLQSELIGTLASRRDVGPRFPSRFRGVRARIGHCSPVGWCGAQGRRWRAWGIGRGARCVEASRREERLLLGCGRLP